ncbi:MAG: response regulator [Thermodesulfobacteriota bacterium]|nr:response regulator [Thermodesulfobacteriota bacterium]
MKQILIIDDEPQIRSMLKKILEREGFDIIVASDGKEGMKLFERNPVDLVITDLIMPEKEGIEIILELRKGYPDVPIIAMSGGGQNSPDGYLNMAKIFGAHATFEKPINKEELLNAVNKALDIK